MPFGQKKRLARIIEDRGAIGRGGRRLLRVAIVLPKGEDEHAFEIPAADVTPARRAMATKAKAGSR